MARPWVKTVFGNGDVGFQAWAAKQGLTTEEEFRLVRRVGVGGRSETIVAVTGTRCFICPGGAGRSPGTSAYTEIVLTEVESVFLMGSPVLPSIVIDTGTDIYRLPTTARPRAARIASAIADAAGLVPNRSPESADSGRPGRALGFLADRSPRSGLTLAAAGSIVAIAGTLVGVSAVGLIVGLLVIVVGLTLAVLSGVAGYLPFGTTGTEKWTSARSSGRCREGSTDDYR